MVIDSWPIARVKPYEKNPRAIPEEAVRAVAESIREFGFRQPIVVDQHGVIIAGHTRWKAACLLELEQVPVHVATDLTEDQVVAYRVADNRVGELTDWDPAGLMAELDGLVSQSAELNALFSELDAEMRKRARAEAGEDDDGDDKSSADDSGEGTETDGLALRPHEHYDYVVILARDSQTWNVLCERLGIREGRIFGRKKTRIGICRAIEADQVLRRIPHHHPESAEAQGDREIGGDLPVGDHPG
jgi:ParB-like chromosome segregation protein Spo0J